MNNPKFKDYLVALGKEQDTDNILKLLVRIRSEVDWPKHGQNIKELRETGSLKRLLNLLQTQQRKHILDVCLSILGNCVMDRNVAREMRGVQNVLSSLNHVLKRYPKEDSINGRVFRVVGNLCQHKVDWSNLIISRKPQIITHLIELLLSRTGDRNESKEKISEATILMAIRSLKYLFNQYTVQHLVKSFPVLNAIGCLFITFSREWQTGRTNQTILNAIISLIHNISVYKDYGMLTELKCTSEGNALEQLVNVSLLCPKTVIKIVMNFIGISKLNSDLPVLDICNKFIEELNKNIGTEGSNTEYLEYVKCLCDLLDHPANRTSQQCGKTVPALIRVLRRLEQPTEVELECCVLLVNTLNKCRYAECLVEEQLQNNVLDVVVKKLEWIAGDTEINRKHGFKRKSEFDDGDSDARKRYGTVRSACACCLERSDRSNFDCPMPHGSTSPPLSPCASEESYQSLATKRRSPSPCSSSSSDYAALSWASPCSSPRSSNNEIDVYSDSDDYSPVCSEVDSAEYALNATIDTEESVESDRRSECTEAAENASFERSPDSSTNRLKISLIYEITRLIRSYIKIHPPVLQLGSETLLVALLNCSAFLNSGNSNGRTSNYLSIVDAVCDIIHSPDYLLALMRTLFVEKIYDLTDSVHSKRCIICTDRWWTGKLVLKRLTDLAEGVIGKGHIAHAMRKGSFQVKEQIVLAIPYVVENKKLLAKLLLSVGGLYVLTRILKEDSDRKRRAIKALCVLASKKLAIANPKEVAVNDTALAFDVRRSVDAARLVTFKLDDGRCVRTDRDSLTEKSIYFSSLLNGFFKESAEDEVRLRDVKFKTLNCILDLLARVNSLNEVDIDTLLDVMAVSDRYLMGDVCDFVTNYVEKHRMSSRTVPVIYRWSLESGLNLLRVESIAYALVADFVDGVRFCMFNKLFNLGYSDELVGDIDRLLERYLCPFLYK